MTGAPVVRVRPQQAEVVVQLVARMGALESLEQRQDSVGVAAECSPA